MVGFTVIVEEAVAVWHSSLTVTVYVWVDIGETFIEDVVSPLDHK